ncbi:MAG TPA: glycosyltransferase family A protein [Oligoflexia bacterium]|nr:glycosyltransferase family A protein [Oligoflexia bacterium]HMR23807.1 glycosyltransferase family A protein [Oligoflexia bacterium]
MTKNKTFIHPKKIKFLCNSLSPKINLGDNKTFVINNKTLLHQSSNQRSAQPLVTVILTVYNDERYVIDAINSILMQSHKNIELIIVNDCSTDNTQNVIDKIVSQHSNISAFHLEKNRGTYFCRNVGLSHAKGDYITFHDSDDISKFDRIEISLKKIGRASALIGHHIRVSLDGEPVFIANSPQILQRFSLITLFIKRDVVDKVGFLDTVKVGGDSEYLSRIKRNNLRVKAVDDVFYYARLQENSLTRNKVLGVNDNSGKKLKKNILRTHYIKNYKYYHSKYTHPKISFNSLLRAFPAPYLNISSLQSNYLEHIYPPLEHDELPSLIKNSSVELSSNLILDSITLSSPIQLIQQQDDKKRAHVITSVYRKEFFKNCINNFNRQLYQNKHLTIVDNCKQDMQDYFMNELKKANIKNFSITRVNEPNNLGLCLNQAIKQFSHSDDIIFKFDDDDYYSPYYIHEQLPYLTQFDTLVGKACIFYFSHTTHKLYLRPIKNQYCFVFHVAGCTLAFSYKKWREVGQFTEGLKKGTDSDFIKKFLKLGIQPFSTSIFNCCAIRYKNATHTWNANEEQLFHPKIALLIDNISLDKVSYYTDLKNILKN